MRHRRIIFGGLLLVVLAAGLVIAAGRSRTTDHPNVGTDRDPATLLASIGDPPTDAAVSAFVDHPLCAGAMPTAPPIAEGRVLISALKLDGDCVRAVLEPASVPAATARVEELRRTTGVLAATVERPVTDTGSIQSAGDPRQAEQWAIKALGLEGVWTRTRGAGIRVGVIESSFDRTHEDLQAFNGVMHVSALPNHQRHGTHVVGIVSADAGNGLGGVGVAPEAELVFVSRKLPGREEDMTAKQIDAAFAVRAAVDLGARVVNLSFTVGSLGDMNRPDAHEIELALRYAAAKDVVVVMANGNCAAMGGTTSDKCPEADHTLGYPAVFASVIGDWNRGLVAVGATDADEYLADFSTRGIAPTISAPGVAILSSVPGTYESIDGTSMAAPHVTGVVALLRATHRGLTAPEVVSVLRDTATPATGLRGEVGPVGRAAGAGIVNPVAAMNLADQRAPSLKAEDLAVGFVQAAATRTNPYRFTSDVATAENAMARLADPSGAQAAGAPPPRVRLLPNSLGATACTVPGDVNLLCNVELVRSGPGGQDVRRVVEVVVSVYTGTQSRPVVIAPVVGSFRLRTN